MLVTGLFPPLMPTAPVANSKDSSTLIKDRAFNVVCEEEGFSPHSLAAAQRVFWAPDLAEEYLSFKPKDSEARTYWLLGEMEHLSH